MLPLIAATCLLLCPQEKVDEAKVQELIKKLGADDLQERDQATTELLAMGDAVVPLLEKAKSAADADTKARLEKVISEVTVPARWAKEILEGDSSQGYQRLEEALRTKALDRTVATRIVNILLLSESAAPDLRQNMISLAERHRLRETWPALVQLTLRDDQEAQYAVYALQRMKPPPEAANAILKALPKIKNYSNVIQLIEVVRTMKPDRAALETALEGLLDPETDDNIRYNVLSYIQQGRLPGSLRLLLRCWKTSPALRQSYVYQAILRCAPDASLKDLLELLKGDQEEQFMVVDYVARQKVKDAAGALAEALLRCAPDDRTVRPRIVNALKGLRIDDQVKQWLAAAGPLPRATVLTLVGELDVRAAAPDAVACLDDKDPAVRRAAAAALGTLRHADAASALEKRLADADAGVRHAALAAFARAGGKAATTAVLRELLGESPDMQAAALEVIGLVDVDAVLDELTKEANLGRHMVRYALAVLIVSGGESTLHRVMARTGGKLGVDDLHAMVRLIQAARTGRPWP